MKVNLAPYLEELKGRLGQTVLKKRGTSTTLERKSVPYSTSGGFPSDEQTAIREKYRYAIETWNAATTEERDAWNQEGKTLLLSGFNVLVEKTMAAWIEYDPSPIFSWMEPPEYQAWGAYQEVSGVLLLQLQIYVPSSNGHPLSGFTLPKPTNASLPGAMGFAFCQDSLADPSEYLSSLVLNNDDVAAFLRSQPGTSGGSEVNVVSSFFYRL